MRDIDELSLEFMSSEVGARHLAGVMNQLLIHGGLIAVAEDVMGAEPINWTKAFMDGLNSAGCRTVTALAALARGKSDPEAAQMAIIRMHDRVAGRT